MIWSRTNQLIIAAADRLGVGWEPLSSDPTDYFLRLRGPGKPVVVSKTRSPFLTQVAQTLSNNKHVSRELLAARGIPVVPDLLVDGEASDAAELAELAGLAGPWIDRYGSVVVKPNWGNRARGVAVEIADLETLQGAVDRARAVDLDEEAVIEPHLPGTNIRVAVIGGRVEAAAQIVRPRLRGDGARTLADLIAELNADPRRGSWERPGLHPLDAIELDSDLRAGFALRGLGPGSVVPAGTELELLTDEVDTVDWTDRLHPGWADAAVQSCRMLGVDVGGVDLRGPAETFEAAPTEAGDRAGLLEVNVLPALHIHALPTKGQPRPVFDAFVAYCVSLPGAPAPLAAVEL